MRGDALKELAAVSLSGDEPTETQMREALADGIDVLLHLGGVGERMTVALERLASCVDAGGGASPPSFCIHQQ